MTDPAEPRLRVLSLGAGVQSTTVLLMSLRGELDPIDHAIFANTGWEPRAVYDHLARLREECDRAGVPLHVVSNGSIRDTERQDRFFDAPFFLLHPDGAPGMARRQCTNQLKLRPIRWKIRELMTEAGIKPTPGAVDLVMGISIDEFRRVRDSDVKYLRNVYPLIDRKVSRAACREWLEAAGWTAPRSACIGCPYRTNEEWRALEPDEFADAVAFEREVQASDAGQRGPTPYLHAQRVPLDLVNLLTLEDQGQLTFDEECAGICGV